MKITKVQLKEMIKDIIKEQVGGMTPPSSSMEEESVEVQEEQARNFLSPLTKRLKASQQNKSSFGNLDRVAYDIDKSAQNYFTRTIWPEAEYFNASVFRTLLKDLVAMAQVKKALKSGNVSMAVKHYRSCDRAARDAFPASFVNIANKMLEKQR